MVTKACIKAILHRDGKLLILQRSNLDDIGPGDWEFPGGTIEWSERAEDALHRELMEEIGVRVITFRLAYISSFFLNDTTKVFVINYLVEGDGGIRLSQEHQRYLWASDDEARALLVPGVYHDYHQYITEEWL